MFIRSRSSTVADRALGTPRATRILPTLVDRVLSYPTLPSLSCLSAQTLFGHSNTTFVGQSPHAPLNSLEAGHDPILRTATEMGDYPGEFGADRGARLPLELREELHPIVGDATRRWLRSGESRCNLVPLFCSLVVLAHHVNDPASNVVSVELGTHGNEPFDIHDVLAAKE